MKNPKGFIPIAVAIIIVIVAAILAGGSYYYTKTLNNNTNGDYHTDPLNLNGNLNTNNQVNSNTNSATNSNVNSSATEVDVSPQSITAWQTYISLKLGLSFKYPSTCQVSETAGEIEIHDCPRRPQPGMSIAFTTKTAAQFKKDFVAEDPKNNSIIEQSSYTLDGVIGEHVRVGCQCEDRNDFIFINPGKQLQVSYNYRPWQNAILSTFTFLDDITGWKTYTNSTYNYSLQYPANWVVNADVINTVRVYPGAQQENSNGMPDLITVSISNTGISEGPVKPHKVVINGHEATAGIEYGFVNFTTTVFNVNNQYIKIWWQDGLSDQTIQNQILSTFQFLDDTAGWKTYTNETYHYTLRYPSGWRVQESVGRNDNGSIFNSALVRRTQGGGSYIHIAHINADPISLPFKNTETLKSQIDGREVTKKIYISEESINDVSSIDWDKKVRYTFTDVPDNWGSISAVDFLIDLQDPEGNVLLEKILSTFTFTK